jgi:hypothetical protein
MLSRSRGRRYRLALTSFGLARQCFPDLPCLFQGWFVVFLMTEMFDLDPFFYFCGLWCGRVAVGPLFFNFIFVLGVRSRVHCGGGGWQDPRSFVLCWLCVVRALCCEGFVL